MNFLYSRIVKGHDMLLLARHVRFCMECHLTHLQLL